MFGVMIIDVIVFNKQTVTVQIWLQFVESADGNDASKLTVALTYNFFG